MGGGSIEIARDFRKQPPFEGVAFNPKPQGFGLWSRRTTATAHIKNNTADLKSAVFNFAAFYLLKIAEALGRGFFLLCFFSIWIGVLISILANTVQRITRMYMPNTA